jgi:hypothetical protein
MIEKSCTKDLDKTLMSQHIDALESQLKDAREKNKIMRDFITSIVNSHYCVSQTVYYESDNSEQCEEIDVRDKALLLVSTLAKLKE